MSLTAERVQVISTGGTLTGLTTSRPTFHFPNSSGWEATFAPAGAENEALDTMHLEVPVPLTPVAIQFVRRSAAENTRRHREWKAD